MKMQPVLIEDIRLFCKGWTLETTYGYIGESNTQSIRLNNVYFKSIEDVLEFCKLIINKAKIIKEDDKK